MRVQSELGKGTTFAVYLPACDESSVDAASPEPIRHRGTGRILVMDDDEAVRRLLRLMLESIGYSVTCEESGNAALDYFKAQKANETPLSAVIVDLTIPGGAGGKEIAQEIRRMDTTIPIFVASGYAEDPVMASPGDYGITASIGKPFSKEELMGMLERHIPKPPGPS